MDDFMELLVDQMVADTLAYMFLLLADDPPFRLVPVAPSIQLVVQSLCALEIESIILQVLLLMSCSLVYDWIPKRLIAGFGRCSSVSLGCTLLSKSSRSEVFILWLPIISTFA